MQKEASRKELGKRGHAAAARVKGRDAGLMTAEPKARDTLPHTERGKTARAKGGAAEAKAEGVAAEAAEAETQRAARDLRSRPHSPPRKTASPRPVVR